VAGQVTEEQSEGPDVAEQGEDTDMAEQGEDPDVDERVQALPDGATVMSASDGTKTTTAPIIKNVSVADRKPGHDRHAIRDRDLAESLDED
jgi:hypothetical protein